VQDHSGIGSGGFLSKPATNLFKLLLDLELDRRIGCGGLEVAGDIAQVRSLTAGCLAQCMLMEHVAGNGIQVCLRVANGLMVIQSKQAQENLLDEIGHIRRGVAHA